MNVKVLKKFRDKHTGELFEKGDVLTISEGRYNELKYAGRYVQKIAEAPDATPETLKDGFDVMTMSELREYADKAYKLTFGRGTKKAEMIETLRRMERANK